MNDNLIIVTGGAGFIGVQVLELLCQVEQSDIWVIDSITYAADVDRVPKNSRIQLFKNSISNFKEMENLFLKAATAYARVQVIHLAAESHVDRSIKSGSIFIETNVLGTQNLLELSSKIGVERFLHVSTDEVYGDIDLGESTETDQLKPSSAYAASKAASDLLVLAHIRTHGLNAIITRCTNNFGPFQAPEKFVPRVVNRLLNSQTIPVYGKGDQIREWISVDDHSAGILKAFSHGENGQIYNFGSGWRLTNLQLIEKISNILNINAEIEFVPDRLGHDRRYALNSTKAKDSLGWKLEESSEQKFSRTITQIAQIARTPKGRMKFIETEKFYAN